MANGELLPLEAVVDVSRFGGKAVSLGEGLRHGLPVPGGFGLDVAFVRAVVAREPQACDRLVGAFEEGGSAVAVRSSAIGEDSAAASFAGQHLTVQNVRRGADVIEAVIAVHGSATGDAALAYRERMGLDGEAAIAVVMQRQIMSEVAGVLFTRNPVTGAREIYIEAAWGLGEVIVAGSVIPDTFRLDLSGAILERRSGEKDLRLEATAEGSVEEIEIHGGEVTRLCLADDRLQDLHALALDCERAYGEGADIEWAVSEDTLFLLQCRAITA